MATLGNLVVNVTGNTGQLQNALNKGRSQVTTFTQGVRGAFGGLVGALGPVAAAVGTTFAAGKSIAAARTQIQAEQKLAAVLKATQGAAGLSAQEIASYASELQGVTNFGDEATIAAASVLATFKEIKGDTFKETLGAAQDLSTVMGQDLQTSVVQLGKALNDPINGVTALRRVGVSFTQSQLEQIRTLQESGDLMGAQRVILNELKSEFGGAATALADPWTQMNNTIGDVGENIGFALMPSLNVVAQALGGMFGQVSSGTNVFKEFGIEAAVILQSLGGFLVLTITQWQLFFVQIGAGAAHFFTQVMPAYLSWLASNWLNVISDIGQAYRVVFINVAKNLFSIWDGVLNYIRGKPVQINKTDLLDGFKATVSALPDIPDRAVTELEKSLMRDVNAISEHLGSEMQANREKLQQQFNPTSAPAIPALGKLPDEGLPDTIAAAVTAGPIGATAQAGDRGPEFATALRKGSSEALSALQRASNPNRKLESLSEKQLKQLEQLNKSFSAGSFPTPETTEVLDYA